MKRLAGRRLRGEADAQACLWAAEASGLTRAAWAHANGVDARSLNIWRVILERKRSAGSLRLVELVTGRPSAPTIYTVYAGDFRVEVDAGFDPEVLRRLLAVVAAC